MKKDLGPDFYTAVYSINGEYGPLSVKDMEVLTMAKYFIESECWLMDVADHFGYAYSTTWRKLHLKLEEICPELHKMVLERIEENKVMRGLYNLDAWRKKNCPNYGKYVKIRRKN